MRAAATRFVIGMVLALAPALALARTLTVEERIDAQRAIEQVYWNHRIWPKDNPSAKPELAQVMPDAALRAKVLEMLDASAARDAADVSDSAMRADVGRFRSDAQTRALRDRGAITPALLQAELDRMAANTRDPVLLAELFHALGDDAFVIAETLGRQTLVERTLWERSGAQTSSALSDPKAPTTYDLHARDLSPSADLDTRSDATYVLPLIPSTACTDDTWTGTRQEAPDPRSEHTAVWTGTEMIIWGGGIGTWRTNTGGRYNPTTDTWTLTSRGAGVPTARMYHAAVWTGTEMIVWGGFDGADTNTGGRYNPTTDTWTPTSVGTGVPAARVFSSAVWTGTRMIVWGGTLTSASTYFNTGGRYDPATDTWASTSTGTNVPEARRYHSAIWTGTEMIVWGGGGFSPFNTGGRYNPTTDVWTATSIGTNVPTARWLHAAVWTGTQMIVWGGGGGGYPNTGGRYTPGTNTWTATSTGTNVPEGRLRMAAAWTGTYLVVWGGYTDVYKNTGGRYNPTTNAWLATSTGANVPSARGIPTGVWTGSRVVVWGGTNGNDAKGAGGNYDPAGDTWSPQSTGATVPSPRTAPSAVWTGAEMIVWGGQTALGEGLLNTGGRYTPATDSWAATSVGANVPSARSQHAAVWTGLEMIVWGGLDAASAPLNTGGRYSPTVNSWAATSTGANLPAARSATAAVWTGTRVIVWGGLLSGGGFANTGGKYDPVGNTWAATSTGAGVPIGRPGPTAIWNGSEMIVWGGGVFLSISYNTGGRYNPLSDTWTATSTGANVPSARVAHTAVWTGTEMIVWGGIDPSLNVLNTGGRYAPGTDSWTPTSTGAGTPAARELHSAAWTGQRMIIWGGTPLNYQFNTGGRYDPDSDSWQATSITGDVPSPRDQHAMAWTGTEMVVWGGTPANASGGRYCGCPTPAAWYRDMDADGYGTPATTKMTCDGSTPSGYVAGAGDCNDGNGAVHPGTAELCNTIDDDCDGSTDEGIAAPSAVPALTESKSGSSATLVWTAASGANAYDVVKGTLSVLQASFGNFTTSTTACLGNNLAATSVADAPVPPAGDGWWHLVRAVNTCAGSGSYDTGAASQQGSRDAEIGAAGPACP